MITLNPTGSPAETSGAYALLEIIANPDRAKKHLDALLDAKVAANEAHENARKLAAEAKENNSTADEKLAQAQKLHDDFNANHTVRTNNLDERHAFLVGEAKRLTNYEATVAAREKELIEPLAARERAVADRENATDKRETEL